MMKLDKQDTIIVTIVLTLIVIISMIMSTLLGIMYYDSNERCDELGYENVKMNLDGSFKCCDERRHSSGIGYEKHCTGIIGG